MMKLYKYLFLLMAIALLAGCEKEEFNDTSFLSTANAPDKINTIIDITNDNSGKVTITPVGQGIGSFLVYFGDNTKDPVEVAPGKSVSHNYAEGKYNVKVVGRGVTGLTTENTFPIDVVYREPENLKINKGLSAHTLTLSAAADYAQSFLVYFGDKANEQPVVLNPGEEITHEYVDAGDYEITVIALSGGAAKTELTETIKITDPFTVPITFDNPTINYFFGTFGGASFEKVANPNPSGINTSSLVGKYIKNPGAEVWSGTYSPLNQPIDFTKGNIIKMLVYADPALVGKKINVELEYADEGNPANGVAVLKMPILKGNEWHEIVFDFSTNTGIPGTARFNQLVLRFDDGNRGSGEVFYIDNIILTF